MIYELWYNNIQYINSTSYLLPVGIAHSEICDVLKKVSEH